MNKLSVVIPVFNNWNYTRNCIEKLLTVSRHNLEIIIVDNASTDDTLKEISKYDLLHIRNEKNLGFAAAVNLGINQASSNYIMILNNDIKFGDEYANWFLSLPEFIEKNQDGLIGPTAGYVDPKTFDFKYETHDASKPINYMSGWCLMAHKDVWKQLDAGKGPFDEQTFFLYYEDTDLGFRALKQNLKFHIIETPLKHIGKQTSKLLNTNKYYLESRGKFLKKWRS